MWRQFCLLWDASVGGLISVIVTTYRREDALGAVLRSLSSQTDPDFEVVIADDGSGQETTDLVDIWKSKLGHPLTHVWHEDRGFRAAEIRNRAIMAARGEYCVFLDGDCIVRFDFVAAHRRLAEPNWFVTGNRALLSGGLTARVLRDGLTPERWGVIPWTVERWRGGLNRLSALVHLPLGPLRRLRRRAWRGARSCNFAVWRSDLARVNGFDADYRGWGKEDSDIIARLLHAGVRRKDGMFMTGVLHLWHEEADRVFLRENERKLSEVLASSRIRARCGLAELDEDSTAAVSFG